MRRTSQSRSLRDVLSHRGCRFLVLQCYIDLLDGDRVVGEAVTVPTAVAHYVDTSDV